MKQNLSRFASLAFVPFLLLGCAATQLRPGAEGVFVTHAQPPEQCRFVTTLVGEEGGSLTGPLTSNKHLAEGAVNDLKNQAYEKGANYVVLETTTAGDTVSGGRRGMSGGQTDVTHMGNAFVCPPRQDTPPRPDQAAR